VFHAKTSNEFTYMNQLTRKNSNRKPPESEDKHGKKVVWVTIQIPSNRLNKVRLQGATGQEEDIRNADIDYGRFVHGIKNAFAT